MTVRATEVEITCEVDDCDVSYVGEPFDRVIEDAGWFIICGCGTNMDDDRHFCPTHCRLGAVTKLRQEIEYREDPTCS